MPNLKIAVIDLDVHQGDGNSSILKNDKNVFIFSMHGEKNYPFIKVPSHLDIALPNGVEDHDYLEALHKGMESIKGFKPDYIFYQTGVDPLSFDALGKMNLSFEGLMTRDQIVIEYALDSNIPISLALGGGYAKPIEKSVEAYANTYRVIKTLKDQRK
jgi:acetoin utilization deacetylase AcuC-like enzyme